MFWSLNGILPALNAAALQVGVVEARLIESKSIIDSVFF